MLNKYYIQLLRYLKTRKGQTLVEYGLILALVSIVVIAVLTLMGDELRNMFNEITTTLATVN